MSEGKRRVQADGWGIQHQWVDASGEPRTVSAETVRRLRTAIGQPPPNVETRAPIVTRPGRELGTGSVEIACEDGVTRRVSGRLPVDFPLGYHELVTAGAGTRRLIVSPGRCSPPPVRRAWGWAVQLYATRSRESWGIGDLADLEAVRRWSQTEGAGFLLLNPLHAVAPTLPQQASPYLPATRRYRSPLYLRVQDIPGADRVDLSEFAARGRALNQTNLIDRDEVWQLKRQALWRIFSARDEAQPAFASWRRCQGPRLQEFAVWSALAQTHGPDWREWERDVRQPDAPAVARFAATEHRLVTFYAWLQWLLDVQLRDASGDLPVLHDLPVGVDAGGSDAWTWQGVLAQGVTVGAPPDSFNRAGQAWGSPPLIPWRLREDNYQPFIESIRATMAAAGGIRIDHVMGLFRLWWVPDGCSPTEGAYVRYPSEDLLDIVALESHRAGAIVVGEDLGTVEPGVREAMRAHGMLSYRLLWFEGDDPACWSVDAMAAVTTHDLPTVAGLWTGADLADQRSYPTGSGIADSVKLEAARDELLSMLRASVRLDRAAASPDVVRAVYALLGRAPSKLLTATLEDALTVVRRPNLPGAADRPNWCLPLPVSIEDLSAQQTATDIAKVLREAVRSGGPNG